MKWVIPPIAIGAIHDRLQQQIQLRARENTPHFKMDRLSLDKLNPLNMVQTGKKVEHPTAGYSNTISRNVESMHADFSDMHKGLKNLVMLYKTRHQLMESLNENGLYVSILSIGA